MGDWLQGWHQILKTNIRYVNFLDSRLDDETVVLLVRGIDGASILPLALGTLPVRWPQLCFRMALMVEDSWVLGRAADLKGCVRAQQFDGKRFKIFEGRRLLENFLGVANDMNYRHLLLEWDLGSHHREEIGYAMFACVEIGARLLGYVLA